MRRPLKPRPLPSREQLPHMVVLHETWLEDLDTRLTAVETTVATAKRWAERAAWGVLMAALFGANAERPELAALIVKLLVAVSGG